MRKNKYEKSIDIINNFIIKSHNLEHIDEYKYDNLENVDINEYLEILQKELENKIKSYGKILQKKTGIFYNV